MNGAHPLPWVKLHTKLVNHLQLRSIPISERGIFLYLLMLGGISSQRGTIVGTDREIATAISAPRSLVTRAVERLANTPFEMLRRTAQGVEIANWDAYQVAKGSDPDYWAARRSNARPAARPLAANEREDGEETTGRTREEQDETVGPSVGVLMSIPRWLMSRTGTAEFAAELAKRFPAVDMTQSLAILAERNRDGDPMIANSISGQKRAVIAWLEGEEEEQ